MAKFYFYLWFRWALRVTLCSIAIALSITLLITSYIYFAQGMPNLSADIYVALYDVGVFWFSVVWNLAFLIALFRSIKYIFNKKLNGYELKLQDCKLMHYIEVIGYGDLVKVWRKWFMLLIWLVVVTMIFSTSFLYIFSDEDPLFSWFSIYYLYGATLLAGYIALILLSNRCKRVKTIRC